MEDKKNQETYFKKLSLPSGKPKQMFETIWHTKSFKNIKVHNSPKNITMNF